MLSELDMVLVQKTSSSMVKALVSVGQLLKKMIEVHLVQ